ncbi:unnamed protein product [Polarella glacialis]|uniref:Uncharacterized protein n=1 Tax=Polarella glacialis TaxID=89957 RepID=A0A813G1P1_POLGL|nr:unnamed protein product [Polarella glacialis]|mmetsp:Transcript_52971/g.85776  ORF Transcript_52971/g.85776 Transcript_52971/m.85776 type:complete len:149 (-) Transcript_52971:57-503(-)
MSCGLQLIFFLGTALSMVGATTDQSCNAAEGLQDSDVASALQVEIAEHTKWLGRLSPQCYGQDFKGKCYKKGPRSLVWTEELCNDTQVEERQEPNDGKCSTFGHPSSAYCCCGCAGSDCGCCSAGGADDKAGLLWPDNATCHSAARRS